MDLRNLSKILSTEPKYRQKQINEAIFKQFIENWQEASFLPLALREKLSKECPLDINAEIISPKAVITLNDELKIETVLMRHGDDRNTVCASSQVGCPLCCLFCATGQMGFKRNLEPMEIVEQVLFFSRQLKKEEQKVNNIVFMGMGEPFLNYDNVMEAIKILNDKNCFNIGARHISISTVGITEGIEKLADEPLQVNLAISLHAPNDKLRDELIPLNKKYPIAKILGAVDDYIAKTNRQVMFEYILIKNKNDNENHARELVKLLNKKLYMVNLILYNPTGMFESSSPARIKKFKEILEKEGIRVTQRYRFGKGEKAACGQLVGK